MSSVPQHTSTNGEILKACSSLVGSTETESPNSIVSQLSFFPNEVYTSRQQLGVNLIHIYRAQLTLNIGKLSFSTQVRHVGWAILLDLPETIHERVGPSKIDKTVSLRLHKLPFGFRNPLQLV
jgi:hypothetical protein